MTAQNAPEPQPVEFFRCAHCGCQYPDTVNRCPACGCLDTADTYLPAEPRQEVTPAGTAYLLPGIEPAPVAQKGGGYQGRLFST